MGIKESALSAITSITQSDYVRAVTSAGASRKITVANLAKAIVESYTGSTLAGTSQSVKSAIDSLNGLSIDISSERTFNIENGSRVVIDVIGSNNTAKGTIYVYCTGVGYVSAEKVGLSGATITTGTNSLTVSGISAGSFIRVYRGSIS